MSPLKKRAVAGSFIFKFPDNDQNKKPQVALFQPSDRVRTYKNKYDPISGTVEEKPYSFVDEFIGREWTIQPFAFSLLPESGGGVSETGIKLYWEHRGYKWFDPDEVSVDESFGGVPRLLESLRRAWFNIDLGDDAGNALLAGLRSLQNDHESGARQLASTALNIFADVVEKTRTTSRQEWWRNVRFAAWHMWKNGRESMGASILSVMLSSLSIIGSKLPPEDDLPHGFTSRMAEALKAYCKERGAATSKISRQFASFLSTNFSTSSPVKILTLSSSSTTSASLIETMKTTNTKMHLRILEPRPLFEGVPMAKKIAAIQNTATTSKITVFTDASAAIASVDVDIVVIGADIIDREGNVSNKVGSLPAILSAKHISPNPQIVVLSERENVLPYDPPGHEENDPRELINTWTASVRDLVTQNSSLEVEIKNVYFEWIPRSHYITEDGASTADEITNWAHIRLVQANDLFDAL